MSVFSYTAIDPEPENFGVDLPVFVVTFRNFFEIQFEKNRKLKLVYGNGTGLRYSAINDDFGMAVYSNHIYLLREPIEIKIIASVDSERKKANNEIKNPRDEPKDL